MYAHQRLRSACTIMQSDQTIVEYWVAKCPTYLQAKNLDSDKANWNVQTDFESSLYAHANLYPVLDRLI